MKTEENLLEQSSKLDLCQALCIFMINRLFNTLSEAAFSVRHPILDWNRHFSKKIPLELPKYPGMRVKSISRVQFDNVNSQYHYVAVEHDDHPEKFCVIKYWNDHTKEEILALENQLTEFFEQPFALSGYKPSKFRELTAKPHQAKEEPFDPRYGPGTTYRSNNR